MKGFTVVNMYKYYTYKWKLPLAAVVSFADCCQSFYNLITIVWVMNLLFYVFEVPILKNRPFVILLYIYSNPEVKTKEAFYHRNNCLIVAISGQSWELVIGQIIIRLKRETGKC